MSSDRDGVGFASQSTHRADRRESRAPSGASGNHLSRQHGAGVSHASCRTESPLRFFAIEETHGETIRAVLPLLVVILIGVLLITYFPTLTTALLP